MKCPKLIIAAGLFINTVQVSAVEGADSIGASESCAVSESATRHPGLVSRILNYFGDANKSKPSEHLDFSFIGGPHYSSDSKLGLGLMAAGVYTLNPEDSILPPSNMSLFLDAATAAHFSLGARGTHISRNDVGRLIYDVEFSSINTKFWGIGYDQCNDDDNESDFKYFSIASSVSYDWRLTDHLYLGPLATIDYVAARDFDNSGVWLGLQSHSFNYGVGLSLFYDSRDNTTGPTRGWFVQMNQRFSPSWLGNKYGFSSNELTVSYYTHLWRNCTLATRLHSNLTWGDTPWGVMPYIGGSYNMRGYFEGRYRDKSELDLCVEFRQHLFSRSGIVVWGGAATLFPKIKDIRLKKILPNYGVGYRWEFKKNINVRLDFGVGRGQTGVIFNINEAF